MASKTLVHTRRRIWVPLVVLLSLLFVPLAGADWLEMADLMAHPEVYDRKTVVVIGQVKDVQLVTDQKGEPTFKFLLADSVGMLKVTSRIPVQNGDQIIVEGTFTRRRQGGRLTVYNEVNALTIQPLNQFNADLVG